MSSSSSRQFGAGDQSASSAFDALFDAPADLQPVEFPQEGSIPGGAVGRTRPAPTTVEVVDEGGTTPSMFAVAKPHTFS